MTLALVSPEAKLILIAVLFFFGALPTLGWLIWRGNPDNPDQRKRKL
jgi:hypothetical protein